MIGSTVTKIITGYGRDHDVSQAQPVGSLRQPNRFIRFQGSRPAALHRAKPARAGADIAEDHEGRRFLRITLHAVGAFGVFANRLQPKFVEDI
jgi:hypothetical protein